jgi:hypothetical protein
LSSVNIIAEQFVMHTRLFNNVLKGVEASNGMRRMSDQINHLQWIAGHLVQSRYNSSAMLGLRADFPYKEKYTDPTQPPPGNRVIDSSINYPPLDELLRLWNEIAGNFVGALLTLSDEQLNHELPFGTPIGDKTMLGFFGFLSSHESSHIGQMGIIRKYLGLEAMSYD